MARRRRPKLIDKFVELRFFEDAGTFHEMASIETLNIEGKLIRSITKNPRPAGTVKGSTLYIQTPEGRVNAARVAWHQHYGEKLPKRTRVKHLDGDVWNNRKENLSVDRAVSHHAITRIGGAVVSLGTYGTMEEAVAAVNAARAAVGLGPVKTRNRKEN